MKATNVFRGFLAGGIFASLASCSSANSDWNKAAAQNTEASYESFLKAHPNDPHAADAQARVTALQDDQAWSAASAAGSSESYQQYLQFWATGKHEQEAHKAIKAAVESAAWNTAQTAGSVAALQSFLDRYPGATQADLARAALAEQSAFRARLASEPTKVRADKKLALLKHRFSAEVHDLYVIPPATQEGPYAIASAGMSQTQAQQTCASLKAAHQFCEVIRADTAS